MSTEQSMVFETESISPSSSYHNRISAPVQKPSIYFTDVLHKEMLYNIAVMSNSRQENASFIKSLMKVSRYC
jgi:hypothetical protein